MGGACIVSTPRWSSQAVYARLSLDPEAVDMDDEELRNCIMNIHGQRVITETCVSTNNPSFFQG